MFREHCYKVHQKASFLFKLAVKLLVIDELNITNDHVKVDQWRVIAKRRVFPESPRLSKMYVAHDLGAISKVPLGRPPTSFICFGRVFP